MYYSTAVLTTLVALGSAWSIPIRSFSGSVCGNMWSNVYLSAGYPCATVSIPSDGSIKLFSSLGATENTTIYGWSGQECTGEIVATITGVDTCHALDGVTAGSWSGVTDGQ